jgi:hypothetical protein
MKLVTYELLNSCCFTHLIARDVQLQSPLVSDWASFMALYELTVFDLSDPILDPMWRQCMFVIPFMTCLGITQLF